MKCDDKPFAAGEYVLWSVGGSWSRREVWGRVERVTPKGTVFATPLKGEGDPEKEREFRGGRGLRHATAHEIATRKWLRERPRRLKYASVYTGLGRELPHSVEINADVNTPERVREAASELVAIADWWDKQPKE